MQTYSGFPIKAQYWGIRALQHWLKIGKCWDNALGQYWPNTVPHFICFLIMALQHWPRAEKVLGQCCPGCKRITFQSWANTFGYIYGCWPNTVNSVSEIMALHWPIHFMLSGPTYPCSLLFRLKILYIRIKRKKNQKLFIIIFDFLSFLNKLKNLKKRIYIYIIIIGLIMITMMNSSWLPW